MTAARTGYLGLGSNLSDRRVYLRHADELLAVMHRLRILRRSGIYESPPWGYSSPHAFLNQVLEISWTGDAAQLLAACRAVEAACGRMRAPASTGDGLPPHYADRTLDIDLLWLDGIELQSPQLTLPHPRALQRAFVLAPWCELAPELLLYGRSLREWLQLLPPEEVAGVQRLRSSAG